MDTEYPKHVFQIWSVFSLNMWMVLQLLCPMALVAGGLNLFAHSVWYQLQLQTEQSHHVTCPPRRNPSLGAYRSSKRWTIGESMYVCAMHTLPAREVHTALFLKNVGFPNNKTETDIRLKNQLTSTSYLTVFPDNATYTSKTKLLYESHATIYT